MAVVARKSVRAREGNINKGLKRGANNSSISSRALKLLGACRHGSRAHLTAMDPMAVGATTGFVARNDIGLGCWLAGDSIPVEKDSVAKIELSSALRKVLS